MIKLSKKVEYGLIALLHIAKLKSDEVTNCREISEKYRISCEAMGKVLQALARAELIISTQGVKGGYKLGKGLPDIIIGEVIEALEGPIHITRCTCENYVCHHETNCNIREPIFHFQDQLLKFIYSVTLESFLKKELIHKGSECHSSTI